MTGRRLLSTSQRFRLAVVGTRSLLVLAFLALIQLLTSRGDIAPLVLPEPTRIIVHLLSTLGTSQFYSDLAHTGSEYGLAILIGSAAGLLIGAFLASLSIGAPVFKPMLATLYAVPVAVFYPVLLVLLGLSEWPVILIASVSTMVPVALNTLVAISEVRPVLVKLANSLSCTRLQRYTKVILPAAMPIVVPGLQLGMIAGMAMTIAMEFLLANSGLGYRISSSYQNYYALSVWSGIVVVVLLAVLLVYVLNVTAKRVRRDLG